MNSIPGREPRADTLDINQPKETHKKGLLLGTDFRHAVEFSRSGRATTLPSRVWSLATLSHCTPLAEMFTQRVPPRPFRARAAQQRERYTTRSTPCTGGPERPDLSAVHRVQRPRWSGVSGLG